MGEPVVRYLGDMFSAIRYRHYGLDLLQQVRQFMQFQGLKAHSAKRRFANGVEMLASSVHGIDAVFIYHPLPKAAVVKKKEEPVNQYLLQHAYVKCGTKVIVWCVDLEDYTEIDGIDWSSGAVDESNTNLVAWKLKNPALEQADPPWTKFELTEAWEMAGYGFTVPPCSAPTVINNTCPGTIPSCASDPGFSCTYDTVFSCSLPTDAGVGGNHTQYWDEHSTIYCSSTGGSDGITGGEHRPALQSPAGNYKLPRSFNLESNYLGDDGYYVTDMDYSYTGDGLGGITGQSLAMSHASHLGQIWSISGISAPPSTYYAYDAMHYFGQAMNDPAKVNFKKVAAIQIFGTRVQSLLPLPYVAATAELVSPGSFSPRESEVHTDFSAAVKKVLDPNILNTNQVSVSLHKTYNYAYKGQLITELAEAI